MLSLGIADAGDKVYRWVDKSGKVHFGDAPPQDATAAEVKIRSFSGEAEVEGSDAAGGSEVVMYTTRTCTVCRRAREHLQKRGIPFSEWDIEQNAYALIEYRTHNGRGVPLIFVGKQRMNGFSAAKLDRMLAKAGYVVKGRESRR